MKEAPLIGVPNATEAIRRAAEANREDKYREFRSLWHGRLDIIKQRFFPDFYTPTDKFDLPTPPVAIEDMRNYRYLASYHLVPDGYGLSDKLTLNEAHIVEVDDRFEWDLGEAALVETISHEVTHEKVNYLIKLGKLPEDTPPHGKFFREFLLGLGIHCNGRGSHDKPCDDPNSPVGVLLKEWGIPLQAPVDFSGIKPYEDWWDFIKRLGGDAKKGRSSLTKWQCPECGLNVRMGIKGDPRIVHDPCSEKKGEKVFFIKPGITQTIYDSSQEHEVVANPIIDIDSEVDRMQERNQNAYDSTDMDDYEDLSSYMDQYSDYA